MHGRYHFGPCRRVKAPGRIQDGRILAAGKGRVTNTNQYLGDAQSPDEFEEGLIELNIL